MDVGPLPWLVLSVLAGAMLIQHLRPRTDRGWISSLPPAPVESAADDDATRYTPPWMAEIAQVWGPEQLPTFEHVVGMEQLKRTMAELLAPAFGNAQIQSRRRPATILLWGTRGAGKAVLATAIAGEFGARLIHVSARFLVSQGDGTQQPRTAMLVRYAQTHTPSVLFIDDLDMLLSTVGRPNRAQVALHDLLNELSRRNAGARCVVVASLQTAGAFAPARQLTNVFDRVIHVDAPDVATRAALLERITMRHRLRVDDVDAIVRITSGRTRAELIRLLHGACALARVEGGPPAAVLELRHIRAAARETDHPTALHDLALSREFQVEVHRLSTALADRFASVGIALVGDEGTGKTTLAMALANSARRHLVTVTVDDANRQVLRRCVERALRCAPSLLLIDMSALPESRETLAVRAEQAPNPDNDAVAFAVDRALATPGVSVIVEARQVDVIEGHLRRPGRLSRMLRVPRPDDGARLRLVRDRLSAVRLRGTSHSALAAQLRGRTPAQIEVVLADAIRNAERRQMSADFGDWSDGPVVTPEDMWRAMHLLADAA